MKIETQKSEVAAIYNDIEQKFADDHGYVGVKDYIKRKAQKNEAQYKSWGLSTTPERCLEEAIDSVLHDLYYVEKRKDVDDFIEILRLSNDPQLVHLSKILNKMEESRLKARVAEEEAVAKVVLTNAVKEDFTSEFITGREAMITRKEYEEVRARKEKAHKKTERNLRAYKKASAFYDENLFEVSKQLKEKFGKDVVDKYQTNDYVRANVNLFLAENNVYDAISDKDMKRKLS